MLILTDTSADIKGKKKVARYIFAKQQEAETGKTFAKPSLEIDSGMGRSSSPFGQQAGEGMFFSGGLGHDTHRGKRGRQAVSVKKGYCWAIVWPLQGNRHGFIGTHAFDHVVQRPKRKKKNERKKKREIPPVVLFIPNEPNWLEPDWPLPTKLAEIK